MIRVADQTNVIMPQLLGVEIQTADRVSLSVKSTREKMLLGIADGGPLTQTVISSGHGTSVDRDVGSQHGICRTIGRVLCIDLLCEPIKLTRIADLIAVRLLIVNSSLIVRAVGRAEAVGVRTVAVLLCAGNTAISERADHSRADQGCHDQRTKQNADPSLVQSGFHHVSSVACVLLSIHCMWPFWGVLSRLRSQMQIPIRSSPAS